MQRQLHLPAVVEVEVWVVVVTTANDRKQLDFNRIVNHEKRTSRQWRNFGWRRRRGRHQYFQGAIGAHYFTGLRVPRITQLGLSRNHWSLFPNKHDTHNR